MRSVPVHARHSGYPRNPRGPDRRRPVSLLKSVVVKDKASVTFKRIATFCFSKIELPDESCSTHYEELNSIPNHCRAAGMAFFKQQRVEDFYDIGEELGR